MLSKASLMEETLTAWIDYGKHAILAKELLLIYQNRFVALYSLLLSRKLFHFLAPSSLQGFSTGRSLTRVYQGHSQTLKILEQSLSK